MTTLWSTWHEHDAIAICDGTNQRGCRVGAGAYTLAAPPPVGIKHML